MQLATTTATRMSIVATICLAIATVSGCATSIQPLGSKETRVELKDIAGKWVVTTTPYATLEEGAKVHLNRNNVGMYGFQVTQEKKTAYWHGEAIELDKTIYVDLLADPDDGERPQDLFKIDTHVFLILEHDKDEIRLFGFDHAKLDIVAMKEKLVASHRDRLIFTADTQRLQEFFKKHGAANKQKTPMLVLKREEKEKPK